LVPWAGIDIWQREEDKKMEFIALVRKLGYEKRMIDVHFWTKNS